MNVQRKSALGIAPGKEHMNMATYRRSSPTKVSATKIDVQPGISLSDPLDLFKKNSDSPQAAGF
jgi:hypothetical protein